MSKLHRLMWIDSQIRAGRYPNCRKIAQQFEISSRQAARDIEYLRYSLDAPLAYCAKNNGYYYTHAAFALPAQYVTREDRETLGQLARQYRNMGGAQAVRLAALFARLTGAQDGEKPDPRQPYQAVISFPPGIVPTGGCFAVSARGDGTHQVEFRDCRQLLSALLASYDQFSIVSPAWLRQRLRQRLAEIFVANGEVGHFTSCRQAYNDGEIQIRGGSTMATKVLRDVRPGKSCTTYIGAVEGALGHAGLLQPTDDLMGMTGMAFQFIVHENLCPSSVTMYDWDQHFAMLDRIGIYSEVVLRIADPRPNTWTRVQDEAVAAIRASIDRGMPVIAWAPTGLLEFGLIYGYDDADGVFFIRDCANDNPPPLLYQNLGISEVPILFYQIIRDRVEVDADKVFRTSLEFGVSEWNKGVHMDPRYASGRRGYNNLLRALEGEDFDQFGLTYLLMVYADAKESCGRYLQHVAQRSNKLKGLSGAAALYSEVGKLFRAMADLAPFPGQTGVDKGKLPRLAELARQCLNREDKAMAEIEKVLG